MDPTAAAVLLMVVLCTVVMPLALIFLMDRHTRKSPGLFNNKLTKDDMEVLEAARAELPERTWEMDYGPLGEPVFKRKVLPKFTITFYKDGVMAPFVFKNRSNLRFVPYKYISGVFPAESVNPWTDQRIPSLQIETADYEVFLVRSIYYNLEGVKQLLRRGIGSRWATVYHAGQRIEGEIYKEPYMCLYVTGGLLQHSIVRDRHGKGAS